jgi:1-acyl-sn-glycerol-3-phosphate acyltransferase
VDVAEDVPPDVLPSWAAAAHARNLASAALRMTYRVNVHGAHYVGTSGPLVIVAPGEGVLVGALLHATAPRPLHVVASAAMQQALPGKAIAGAGDLALSGPGAVATQRRALAALQDGRAVAVAGTAVSPAYLVAVSGAPVVPAILLGATGKVPTDPPRPRTRIDVFYYPPVSIDVTGDPLLAATRAEVAERIRQAVVDAEAEAALRRA